MCCFLLLLLVGLGCVLCCIRGDLTCISHSKDTGKLNCDCDIISGNAQVEVGMRRMGNNNLQRTLS